MNSITMFVGITTGPSSAVGPEISTDHAGAQLMAEEPSEEESGESVEYATFMEMDTETESDDAPVKAADHSPGGTFQDSLYSSLATSVSNNALSFHKLLTLKTRCNRCLKKGRYEGHF